MNILVQFKPYKGSKGLANFSVALQENRLSDGVICVDFSDDDTAHWVEPIVARKMALALNCAADAAEGKK